jgi:exopolysaccharide biosynthesis polyprenyl glycosylphosphotransferase
VARAGRPEQPIAASGAAGQLAAELRRLRGSRTYRELADLTELSPATLRAAAAGEKLPTWRVAHAFVSACGGDAGMIRPLWEDARAVAGRPVTGPSLGLPPVPVPEEVTSAAQLISMMKLLRAWAGNPSFGELNKRCGGFRLPPSTVSDMLRRQKLPRLELLLAFVRACGLDEEQAAVWEQAWHEVEKVQLTQQRLLAQPSPQGSMSDYIEGVARSALTRTHLRSTWIGTYLRSAVLADLCCVTIGAFLAATLCTGGSGIGRNYMLASVTLSAVWVISVLLVGGYDARFIGTGSEEFRKILHASTGLTGALGIFSYVINVEVSREYLLIALPGTTILEIIARYALRRQLRRLRVREKCMASVVAVGAEAAVAGLIQELRRERDYGLSVTAVCLASPSATDEVAGVPVYGGLNAIADAAHEFQAQTVAVLACPGIDAIKLRGLAWQLEKSGVGMCVSPAMQNAVTQRTSIRPTAGPVLPHIDSPQSGAIRPVVKDLFDRSVAAGMLIVLAPLMAVLALTIRLSDRGPAFFTQTRVGKDGRVFRIYKFRTMKIDAEQHRTHMAPSYETDGALLFKLQGNPPVTPIGTYLRRWSIDELPQLINVLLGDMSLVGPRPALPYEAEKYAGYIRSRLMVKPGLTGLRQVSGRSDLTWAESVRLDLRYVENWSLALDLQIIWRTISVIMRRTETRGRSLPDCGSELDLASSTHHRDTQVTPAMHRRKVQRSWAFRAQGDLAIGIRDGSVE